MVLKFLREFTSHLISLGHVSVSVTWIASRARLLLELGEELWTLLLERLAERIVVFKANTILLHEVVVSKLG